MSVALYSSIWGALALFVLAQHGRRHAPAPQWAAAADTIGLVLCLLHIVLAMGVVHHWSHAAAVRATAAQTAAVYGLNWGGGVYVNYLFVLVWTLDAWLSRRRDWLSDAPPGRWAIRFFYAVVIVNAAVVFARGSMRMAGLALVASLLFAWRQTPSSSIVVR
ncbi:MAG TPA: hypothetical protein VH679_13070 [Vicinamibacterales bacterium]